MKELSFINGSLLAAILAGGTIIEKANDGYDYRVLVQMPKNGDKPQQFVTHSTCNYEKQQNEFAVTLNEVQEEKRKAVAQFAENAKFETEFKVRYPRPENIDAANMAEELPTANN